LDTKAVQSAGELAVVATEPTPAGHPVDTAQDQAPEPPMLSSPQSKFRQLQVIRLAHDKKAAAPKKVTQKKQAVRVVYPSQRMMTPSDIYARMLREEVEKF
jgi:hypothetical protein